MLSLSSTYNSFEIDLIVWKSVIGDSASDSSYVWNRLNSMEIGINEVGGCNIWLVWNRLNSMEISIRKIIYLYQLIKFEIDLIVWK